MKLSSPSSLLSSSPRPPLSSTTSSVSGCFAGIVHRILCSRSLPTHPSDQITEPCLEELRETEQEKKSVEEEDKDFVPGIVARLMGLDSMPDMRPNSITRSRSVNSLEYATRGSSDHHQMRGHRRVKSSTLSFLEMPPFVELENEEFLVLSFENGSHEEEEEEKRRFSSSRRKKSDTTSASLPLEDSCPGVETLECSTPTKDKQKSEAETETVKLRRRRRRRKKKVRSVENDSSSEDSSPVSVLDFDQFMTDHEVPTSELDSKLVEPKSRRKLSSEPRELKYRIRRNDSNLMICDDDGDDDDRKTKKSEGKCVGLRKMGSCQGQSYLEMWDQICQMTEAEIAGSKWLYRDSSSSILKRQEEDFEQICADFEQICADFESQIVDQSLDEFVHQLVEF